MLHIQSLQDQARAESHTQSWDSALKDVQVIIIINEKEDFRKYTKSKID